MIAPHYAEPLQRKVASPAPLHSSPSEGSETVGQLGAGDPFEMLENSVGWAWGYGGPSRIVGYVRSDALD